MPGREKVQEPHKFMGKHNGFNVTLWQTNIAIENGHRNS
jgi:hypothetical protein